MCADTQEFNERPYNYFLRLQKLKGKIELPEQPSFKFQISNAVLRKMFQQIFDNWQLNWIIIRMQIDFIQKII